MSAVPSPEDVAEAGLTYVNDEIPGITRKSVAGSFRYFSPNGESVRDKPTLDRIRTLAIPPAYSHVWICPLRNGHLQATGRDARGRKQYRYHPKWIELSNSNKFSRMVAFGSALKTIRDRIDVDLCKPKLSREKVLATVVWFLEKSLIRVGNEEYAKENHSFGLTTMRMRHCKVTGSVIDFKFVGKRGIQHDVSVSDKRMARIVKKIQELPGQELFQYLDSDGHRHTVTSADVNAYLKEITGEEFTAKDFRTWSATVMALAELSLRCEFKSVREGKSSITEAMKNVARQLGNTPAICRKSYVHPGIVGSYLDGSLAKFLRTQGELSFGTAEDLNSDVEQVALALLKKLEKAPPHLQAA